MYVKKISTFVGLVGMTGLLLLGCSHEPSMKASNTVNTYSNPSASVVAQSAIYNVSADDTALIVYESTPPKERLCRRHGCDGADTAREQKRTMAWSHFSFAGHATVNVSKSQVQGELKDIIIRPSRGEGVDYDIISKNLEQASIVIEVLKTNAKLSVEFIDDRYLEFRQIPLDPLLIFADQLESEDHASIPDPAAKSTYLVKNGSAFSREIAATKKAVYFEPGVHELGYWEVPESVMQVYLAGGSYVKGAINSALEHKRFQKGFTVNGRGILSGEAFPWRPNKKKQGKESCLDEHGDAFDCWFDGVKMLQLGTDKFVFEGVTIVNAPHYVISGFRDDNIAWNAHTPQGDDDPKNDALGEGLFSEEDSYSGVMSNFKVLGNWRWNGDGAAILTNTTIEDCFISPFDDAFKTYSDGGVVKDCVIWQTDNGAVFQFGWYPKNIDGLLVDNMDLIHAEWTGRNQNWGIFNFADRGGDRGPTDRVFWLENSVFKNIYTEGPITRVIALENAVVKQQGFRNLVFENIQIEHLVTDKEAKSLQKEGNGTLDTVKKDWFGYPVGRPTNILHDASNKGHISDITIRGLVVDGQTINQTNAQTLGQFTLIGDDNMVVFE